MPLQGLMAVPARLSLSVACLLTLSIGIKVAVGGASLRTVEDQVAGAGSNEGDIIAFLQRHGFRAGPTEAQRQIPIALAEARGCQLLVALVAPQGYHRALLRQLAGPDNRVSFVVDGVTYPDQPVLLTWLRHYWRVLNRYAGRAIAAAPVLGIVASPTCDLPDDMWRDFVAPQPDRAAEVDVPP